MKSRLEIWKYWCKHTQNNILHKLLVPLKLRHSPSFEFLYIRETCKEKYGCRCHTKILWLISIQS